MISSAAEYEHVTGDLDKIRIDGNILPLRGEDGALRGEDVCFLMEAAQERVLLTARRMKKRNFTRIISSEQINRLDSYVSLARGTDSPVWINTSALSERPMDAGGYEGLDAQEDIVGVPEYSGITPISCGDAVSSLSLRKMFSCLRNLNCVNDRYTHTFSFDWHEERSGETGGGSPPPFQVGDVFRYSYGNFGTIAPESNCDYTQTANPATITIAAYPSDREGGLSPTCDRVELWCSARVFANRVIDGESTFAKASYALLKVGESAINPGAQSVTIDATYLSSRAESIISSIIGFTPEKPQGLAFEDSSIVANQYFIFKHLRDKTKWY